MPVFLVERNFAEELNLGPADAAAVNPMNREHGVEMPADVVIEISELRANGTEGPVQKERFAAT